MPSANASTALLEAFLDAFNAHDVDAIMSFFTEDCVSEWTIRGTQPTGRRLEVRGCDLLEFVNGKISRTDPFWKIVD
jgi:hypothetical protein